MNDPRTTLTALVTGVAGVLSYFNVIIPDTVTIPIIGIGSILIGLFAGDSKKK